MLSKARMTNRITYKKNEARMGAAGNIDQCFSPRAMLSGHYGCLLEDDNYWLPDFLAELNRNIIKTDSQLILANQRINDEGRGFQGQDTTTRGDWFCDGVVSPLYLRGSLLLMEGISNGGLVWRLEDKLDLRVGPTVKEAGLQEACRSLLVSTPFLFISRALAVWTSMPQSNSARAQEIRIVRLGGGCRVSGVSFCVVTDDLSSIWRSPLPRSAD